MSKKIGIYPNGYRSQAFSGFIAPGFFHHQHFHVAAVPTKYKGILHDNSMEARYGMPKPSYYGAKFELVKKIECQPPSEPAPSSSSTAKRDLEANFADVIKSPFRNSSFRSPMPSRKPELSIRPATHGRRVTRLASSTPRKLFTGLNESFSSLGISELSFAEHHQMIGDSGFLSDTLANMENDFSRLQQQQTRLEAKVQSLEQEVAAMRKDLKTISGLVGELAAAIRKIIEIFQAK